MIRLRRCVLWALLLLPLPALAALGQKIDITASGAVAGQSLSSRMAPASGAVFSVQQTTDAAGRVIRQFAAADGRVFAVAWQGASLPDLQQLLGGYFPAYRQAQQGKQEGLNLMQGQAGNLVVQSRGRMGAFSGMAYDPSLFPAGVTVDQLK